MPRPPNCPLCQNTSVEHFFERNDPTYGQRDYYLCRTCALIFLDPSSQLSKEEEKARYDTHRNSPDDEQYVRFLNKLTNPLLYKLRPGFRGLDFGCGPGPTVSSILSKHDVTVLDYDPFYFPDEKLLKDTYDFITATEVLEHLFNPHKDIELLDGMLRPGGVLAVMTNIIPKGEFASHWYHRDPAHVSFYQMKTMEWIAEWKGWSLESPEENVILFSKPPIPACDRSVRDC